MEDTSNLTPFHTGQKVVCINDNFPQVATTEDNKKDIGKQPARHPLLFEVLVIDEILGEFLRFNKYDTSESCNWWKYNRFQEFTGYLEIEQSHKANVSHD